MARYVDNDDLQDALEEGIDERIHRIREVGGRPEVVKALRRARRLLVRGHIGLTRRRIAGDKSIVALVLE